ncbi:GIY-YIG nuclease family protein [Bacillus sp. 2205SS5-2]|uniref:GIY-YIG nuclease family protein n=1 Tax=Bacillus sp. 2205SS5-2 TaxID=3109031 RepID=UPI003FA5C2E8
MNGTFKIGKTKHIEKRMNLLIVKLPFEHPLIFLIKSGNHTQTEVVFHKHFANKRLQGEWSNLSSEDLQWVKKGIYTDSIEATINPKIMMKSECRQNN